ncbi:hypothetical protein JOF41_002369 [Saccharothrix coeruleofusca]|nr:hypothetical protein [Saccharothrix coeruleofusca]
MATLDTLPTGGRRSAAEGTAVPEGVAHPRTASAP